LNKKIEREKQEILNKPGSNLSLSEKL